MEGNDQNQFDRWLRLNRWTAPCKVVDSAVFVRDTLELSQVIAHSLDMKESISAFEIYDRLVKQIKEEESFNPPPDHI
jgi:hypothetical protein